MQNKTCTLKGVTCAVCYCTGLNQNQNIKNWLKPFALRLCMGVGLLKHSAYC